jgi:hypothetical protein
MSVLGDIENALVSRLEGITIGNEAAFASIRAAMVGRDVKWPDALLRERMPAAQVAVRSLFVDPEVWQLIRYVAVFIAARSERSQDEARHGGVGGPGLFALIEAVNGELDGASLPGGMASLLTGASTVRADTNTIVMRMTYSVTASK